MSSRCGPPTVEAMSAAVVSALGHAGLRVDAPGVRLLLDPWLSGSGAFLGSWFPFPDNSHLLESVGADVLDCDLVVVSHEHLDHLDLDLLAGLPEDVPVVVPRYPSTIIQRRLRSIGRRHVVVLDRMATPPARGPRGLADRDPREVPDEPRCRGAAPGGRPGCAAHQRRPHLPGPGTPRHGRGRRSDRPDVRADVGGQLAPGLLRVRRRGPGAHRDGEAGRQVQGGHPTRALGGAASGPPVRRPAVLPRRRAVRAERRTATRRRLLRPGRRRWNGCASSSRRSAGGYLLPGDAVDLDGLGFARDPHWAASPSARRPGSGAATSRSTPTSAGGAIDRAWAREPGRRPRGLGGAVRRAHGVARPAVGVLPGPHRHDPAVRGARRRRRGLGRPHRSRRRPGRPRRR